MISGRRLNKYHLLLSEYQIRQAAVEDEAANGLRSCIYLFSGKVQRHPARNGASQRLEFVTGCACLS